MNVKKKNLLLYKDKMSYFEMKNNEYNRLKASKTDAYSATLERMETELKDMLEELNQLRTQMDNIFREMPSPVNNLMYKHFISFFGINELKSEFGYSEQHIRRLINEGIKLYNYFVISD